MTIPGIIHLLVKNKEVLPDLFKENLDIMRRYYKEHEFRIYDDVDIDQFALAYDPVYYDKVISRLPLQIMRVDAVRYLLMEAVGGIYFDFDIRLQRQWEPSGGAVLVSREWTWPKADDIKVSVHNCVFASTAGHPLWRRLLDGIGNQVRADGAMRGEWHSVFDITGPNAISRIITEEHLTEVLDDVHILKPSCIYQPGLSTSRPEDAFFIHQTTGAWTKPSGSISAIDETEHRDLLEAGLGLVASFLGSSPENIDTEASLIDLGFDSLLTLTLQASLEDELGISIPLDDMLRNLSLRELASRATVKAVVSKNIVAAGGEGPGDYPLSEGQRALFHAQALFPGSSVGNLFSASRSLTPLQLPALARALHVLTERHSLLRSLFLSCPEGPTRIVLPAHVAAFKVNHAFDWEDEQLENYLCDAANKPFDLSQGPPFSVEVFLRGERGDILLIVMHHIIADLWSAALLLEELATIYSAACDGRVVSLSAAVPTPYSAFVERQRANLGSGERIESERTYWIAYLKDAVPLLGPPRDHMPDSPVRKGASHWFRMEQELSRLVRRFASVSRVSLYALLLASFEALLWRISGQSDILVGSPVSCRRFASEAGTVGYFDNQVTFRGRFESNLAFADFLKSVQADVRAALANREYPYSLLLDDLRLNPELNRTPETQVVFGFQRARRAPSDEIAAFILGHPGARFHRGCVELEAIPVQRQGVPCDIELIMTEDADGVLGVIRYDAGMFRRKSIDRIVQTFEALLTAIVRDPTCRLTDLPVLSDDVVTKI